MFHPAPFLAGAAAAHALQQAVSAIARCGYDETNVRHRLELPAISALNWRHLPMYRAECLDKRDTLDIAIDLFLLQGTVTPAEAHTLLGAHQAILLEAGILNQQVRARASLFPVGQTLIFSDHAWAELADPDLKATPYNQVMAIGLDSRDLAHCTRRKRVKSALDLCTGSGIHALLAAAHAEQVLAVDINPRAVNCTRFNAQSLALDNVVPLEGDLYEPVGAQRFDLITANPPFVPSPVQAVGFRDGGLSGEDIQKRIVEGLSSHLAPGGRAQMVTELGERDGEPLYHRLRQWLGDAPLDIHILRLESYSASQYAVGHAKGDDYLAFLSSAGLWAANLRRQQYINIHSVVITFEWTVEGKPWEREDSCPSPVGPAGAEIESIFAAERSARRPGLKEELASLERSGPIARFDGKVLGAGAPTSATATLLGQHLKIEYQLNDFERQMLDGLEGPVTAANLFRLANQYGASDEVTLDAVRSLLAKRLVAIT